MNASLMQTIRGILTKEELDQLNAIRIKIQARTASNDELAWIYTLCLTAKTRDPSFPQHFIDAAYQIKKVAEEGLLDAGRSYTH